MASVMVHQPRVAWAGARAFVRVAQSPEAQSSEAQSPAFDDFASQVHDRLGPEYLRMLLDTRRRVLANLHGTGGDRYVTDVEAAKWRVRLEDLLRTRPDLTGDVIELAGGPDA